MDSWQASKMGGKIENIYKPFHWRSPGFSREDEADPREIDENNPFFKIASALSWPRKDNMIRHNNISKRRQRSL